VSAVTAEQAQTCTKTLQPEAPPEWDEELRGLACALCHGPLLPTWRAVRQLDVVVDDHGRPYTRLACSPACSSYDTSNDTLGRIITALRAPDDEDDHHLPP
jgi:hypothetical protein